MISKKPSQLFFDSDVLQAISIKMCLQCLKKDAKQKVEEDLYVIDQNLGDSNYLLSQIKKHNSWTTYLTLLRSLNYASYSRYASVFQIEDPSDSIFIILKGRVSVMLPDTGFESIRQDAEIKQKAAQQLKELSQKFPQFDSILRKLYYHWPDSNNRPAENNNIKPTTILSMNKNININGILETDKEFKNSPSIPINSSSSPTTSISVPSNQIQSQQQQQQPWGTDSQILKLLYPGLALSRTLEVGDYFGEIGVQFNVPRSATLVCLTDCEFAILPATAYTSLRNRRLFDEDKLYSRLRSLNRMFKSLARDKLSLFSRHFQPCSFAQGEEIFNYGDSSEWMYFLEHGEILIEQRFHSLDIRAPSSEYKVNNNAFIAHTNTSNQGTLNDLTYLSLGVGILTDGSYFGEDGVFFQRKEMKRTTRAVAKEQSLVFKISSEYFYSNLKGLIETDYLSIPKIKERIIKQKLEEGEDENDGLVGFENDGPEITTGNKNQHHFLHEHAKQSSKNKQPVQLEDDFLNARNLKSDLFVLYEQIKNKALGIVESPMEKNNSSSELICSDEYLYPKYDISLNPGLFVKRCFRQTGGAKNRLMRQSRRSSTQFLAASVSDKLPAGGVSENSSCQEIKIKSCKFIRTAQSQKLINLPFSSGIDQSLHQNVCSPITKKTHKILSQADSNPSSSMSKYTTPNIHSYYAPNKTYSSIIKGSSSHIFDDPSNSENIQTTNKYIPKKLQYNHITTLSPRPKGFQSQSFILGSTLPQFPAAQKSTKDSLSFIPDVSLMQSQQLVPNIQLQQQPQQLPKKIPTLHKKTQSQMTINSYYFQQFQQPQQQQTYQITKSIREIQQEQLKLSSTQEIQPIQNNKHQTSQQYLPPSISNIPQIQTFSKSKSSTNSDGKQTLNYQRSQSVVRGSAGNQRRTKDTSLHVQSVSSISSSNNNTPAFSNKRSEERNMSRNTNRMMNSMMDEQLSGLECHEKINENEYDLIQKQPYENNTTKEKYGIDSRDMVRNKLRFLYETQDQPSQSSFSSSSYNNHCKLGISLSTFSSSILPKNMATSNKSKLKLSAAAESQLALMASLRKKLADVSTYQASLKQEDEEFSRVTQSVHENKRSKNLFQYNLADSYSAFLHPKDANALLNKLQSSVQSK